MIAGSKRMGTEEREITNEGGDTRENTIMMIKIHANYCIG